VSGPTPVWVVDEDPESAAVLLAADRQVIDDVPDGEPWELGGEGLVWPVTLRDPSQCAAVLEAVRRGVAVVVRVVEPLSVRTGARFVDELHRAAGTVPGAAAAGGTERLTDDQRRLLEALAGGATLTAAAEALGMSPRTASRRLTEAREVLRCATTAEAVVLASRRS
jgi:DNA-binding NarL/FixJ family response regulator